MKHPVRFKDKPDFNSYMTKRLYHTMANRKAITVIYDIAFGEMKRIVMTKEFLETPPLLRLNVLKDLIGGLIEIYNNLLKEDSCAKGKRSERESEGEMKDKDLRHILGVELSRSPTGSLLTTLSPDGEIAEINRKLNLILKHLNVEFKSGSWLELKKIK